MSDFADDELGSLYDQLQDGLDEENADNRGSRDESIGS